MANDWIHSMFQQAQANAPTQPQTVSGGFAMDPEVLAANTESDTSTGTTGDPLASLAGSGLLSSQDIAALTGALGTDGSGLLPGQPLDLPAALQDTAMAVQGRKGATGKNFAGVLPAWAEDIPQAVLGNVNFDPYLGIVSESGDERTYMGDKKRTKTVYYPGFPDQLEQGRSGEFALPERKAPETKVEHTDKTLSATQVANLPYTWDEERITGVMKRMRESGLNVTSFDQLTQTWGAMVDRASLMYSLSEGKNKVTPWDVLDMYKSEAKAAGSLINYESGTRVSTSKSVAHITEGEAWSSLQQTLSQMLGRDPSDQEVRDFTYRMNQLAAQNPSISKTISKYKAGDVTSSSTRTEGGFAGADVAEAAYQQAQSNPDYAEHQAATTYYNATLSALGAIGNVSN